ncbi:arylamine N-acetyltransferase [bacterium]|nr:arylamine N-acetyltransferase [bacterium]
MTPATVDRVLARLGVRRPEPDRDGLARLYSAWCESVSFDNVSKLVFLAEGRTGPLPGSTAEGFFASWLEHGTGGTCWAGNGALHDLLAALGFSVERAAATMMASPGTKGPNHGSVVATIGRERYIVDASILSGTPLRLPGPEEPLDASTRLPRIELRDGRPAVIWRTLRAPDGFPCRFERVGLSAEEWDALHQRTAAWGPFNYALGARRNRGREVIAFGMGQRYSFSAEGALASEPRDRAGRDRFLVEELGISRELVARLPEDRPLPPAPG